MNNPGQKQPSNIVVQQFQPTVVSNKDLRKPLFLNEVTLPAQDSVVEVSTHSSIISTGVTKSIPSVVHTEKAQEPVVVIDTLKRPREKSEEMSLEEPPEKKPKVVSTGETEIIKIPEEKPVSISKVDPKEDQLEKEILGDLEKTETTKTTTEAPALTKEGMQQELMNLYYKINDIISVDVNKQKKKKTSQYIIKQRKKPPQILKQPQKIQDCYDILKYLRSHKRANEFNYPVDYVKYNIPSYPKIVSRPMDLGKIENNLELGNYKNITDFEKDVRQVFYNCHLFNNPQSFQILEGADILNDIFVTKFKDIVNNKTDAPTFKANIVQRKKSAKKRRSQTAEYIPEDEFLPPVQVVQQVAYTLSKEEKENLHKEILYITQQRHDLVDTIVQIINESENTSGTDEIDLEQLDFRTLKKLQKFVSNVKKDGYRPVVQDFDEQDDDSDSSDSSDSESE